MKQLLNRITRLEVIGALAVALSSGALAAEESARPNVIIILADDLGYGDVQCYNPQRGKIPTPHIDGLAAEGMRFTDAHAATAVCSASRYSLLTGRYAWRTPLRNRLVPPFGKPEIAPDRPTIASLAKQQGYVTACIGKWHLGWDWAVPKERRNLFGVPLGQDDESPVPEERREALREYFSKPIPGGPTARGFDYYFGTDVPNWPPYCFIENDRTVGIPTEFLPKRLLHGEPRMASAAGPALKGWNLEAILPALGEHAADFIEQQAKAKCPFLLYLALTAPHEPIAITSEWKGKSHLHYYADFVMETDAIIGRVLDALEKSGVAGNTLVLFTSDNGKASYTGAAELEKLGHYSSGPLRGYKFSEFEGGHRMPFILRWPGVVCPDSVCPQLVIQTDIMATLAQIWGAKLPDNAGEDSFSFLPLLNGSDQPVREYGVSTAASGVPGLRKGPWKLIFQADRTAKTNVVLYNLDEDIGEKRNRAAENPQLVSEMSAVMQKFIADGRSTSGSVQKNDVELAGYPWALLSAPEKPKAEH